MGSLEGGTADAVAAQRRVRRLCDLCCRWQRKEEALVELELVVQLELVQLEVRQQRQPRQQRQQRQKMQMQRKKLRRRQASGGCHPPSSSVSLQPRRRSGCAPFRSADTNAFRMSPFLKINAEAGWWTHFPKFFFSIFDIYITLNSKDLYRLFFIYVTLIQEFYMT